MSFVRPVRFADLLNAFIERTPARDADGGDRVYAVNEDGILGSLTPDFKAETARCVDPVVRARFVPATRRQDIL